MLPGLLHSAGGSSKSSAVPSTARSQTDAVPPPVVDGASPPAGTSDPAAPPPATLALEGSPWRRLFFTPGLSHSTSMRTRRYPTGASPGSDPCGSGGTGGLDTQMIAHRAPARAREKKKAERV